MPHKESYTVGGKMSRSSEVVMLGLSPTPLRLTGRLEVAGSSLFTVRVAVRNPELEGLNLTVMSILFPAPTTNGREGGETRKKSGALGPEMGRELRVRSHPARDRSEERGG